MPARTIYYVTDKKDYKTDMLTAMRKLFHKKTINTQSHENAKVRDMHLVKSNPNFKSKIINGLDYSLLHQDHILAGTLNDRPLGPRGPCNPILIIFDDTIVPSPRGAKGKQAPVR